MRQLINSLLAFSRTDVTDRNFEKTNLNAIIADLKEAMAEDIQEKQAVIATALEHTVNIIPFQFTQLIQNLIANSLKFARPDEPCRITISTQIVSGKELAATNEKFSSALNYCQITFQDNGIGFDPQYNERIFAVFQKLHPRDTYEGTGIGLAIVKKIVDGHNGVITATGEEMKGARFDIYIPE
jgi:signal transduction histidine kinase